jgi:hypothetical protein
MRASVALSALSALFLWTSALPAFPASQASSDSKWLAPEKDELLNETNALPFFPHRANTTDNRLLPLSDFDDAKLVCSTCHKEIYAEWRTSIMSRSWDDPIYRALLKQASEATDGNIDNFCTGCHTPIGLTTGQITPELDREPIEKSAAEHPMPGVDCETCHNISARTGEDNGAYVLTPMLNGKRTKFGPYKDAVSPYHKTVYSELHTRSDFCSVCHNVTHPFTSTAIERTYDEWHDSEYSWNGQQCQSCHMPDVAAKAAIMGPERKDVATHWFNGGNVTLLNHFGQAENAQRSRDLLKSAATIQFVDVPHFVLGQDAAIKVQVTNKGAGHKLPSGFPEGREMWIELTVSDAQGAVIYRSGAVKNGQTEPGTQSFKVHLGDQDGREVATEVWKITHIIADTRIPPEGVDVRNFLVPIPADAKGPFTLDAKLNYWPFSQALADQLLGPGTLPVEIVTMATVNAKVPVAPAPAQVAQSPDLQHIGHIGAALSGEPGAGRDGVESRSSGEPADADRSYALFRQFVQSKSWFKRQAPPVAKAAAGESSGSSRGWPAVDNLALDELYNEFIQWQKSRHGAGEKAADR